MNNLAALGVGLFVQAGIECILYFSIQFQTGVELIPLPISTIIYFASGEPKASIVDLIAMMKVRFFHSQVLENALGIAAPVFQLLMKNSYRHLATNLDGKIQHSVECNHKKRPNQDIYNLKSYK